MRPHVYKFVDEVLHKTSLIGHQVVEFGSFQVGEDQKLRDLVVPRGGGSYLGVDMREGQNVDLVDDLETLNPYGLHYRRVGLVLCCETLEHVKRPWVALKNIRKMLSNARHPLQDSGPGLVVVTVPFTFGIHAHPNDYYRFTAEGLVALFNEAGFCDWVVGQDPAEGIWPHTAVGVAGVGLVSAEVKAVVQGGSWRAGGTHLIPVPAGKPAVAMVFEDEKELREFEAGFNAHGGVWPKTVMKNREPGAQP